MVKCLFCFCFVLILHFKIMVGSYAVVRNNTARSCASFTQFPQGQYPAQLRSNITTKKLLLIQSTDLPQVLPVLHACVYVCV